MSRIPNKISILGMIGLFFRNLFVLFLLFFVHLFLFKPTHSQFVNQQAAQVYAISSFIGIVLFAAFWVWVSVYKRNTVINKYLSMQAEIEKREAERKEERQQSRNRDKNNQIL